MNECIPKSSKRAQTRQGVKDALECRLGDSTGVDACVGRVGSLLAGRGGSARCAGRCVRS
eukprot:1194251-Prorocentrum_minimum.AAC.4